MRHARNPLLPLAALAALAISACASGTEAGWTYAPAPPATPAPSVAPTEAPSEQPGSPAPTDAGSPAPTDAGSPAPTDAAGETVQVSAANIAFDQSTLTVPATTPFLIEFANNDAGVPHNVEIKDQSGASIYKGEIFNGVETRTYEAPPLPAGSYQWICTVHPNMVIDVTAE